MRSRYHLSTGSSSTTFHNFTPVAPPHRHSAFKNYLPLSIATGRSARHRLRGFLEVLASHSTITSSNRRTETSQSFSSNSNASARRSSWLNIPQQAASLLALSSTTRLRGTAVPITSSGPGGGGGRGAAIPIANHRDRLRLKDSTPRAWGALRSTAFCQLNVYYAHRLAGLKMPSKMLAPATFVKWGHSQLLHIEHGKAESLAPARTGNIAVPGRLGHRFQRSASGESGRVTLLICHYFPPVPRTVPKSSSLLNGFTRIHPRLAAGPELVTLMCLELTRITGMRA